uniref:Uncharacterized protein n=1 Tax=Cannabis sativa TaxID=3483 RepID=A0A803R0Q6_CANSA
MLLNNLPHQPIIPISYILKSLPKPLQIKLLTKPNEILNIQLPTQITHLINHMSNLISIVIIFDTLFIQCHSRNDIVCQPHQLCTDINFFALIC